MAAIHLNSTVWAETPPPNYIVDVVLFYFVLFIYLFQMWWFEPSHSIDYRGPLIAAGFKFDFCPPLNLIVGNDRDFQVVSFGHAFIHLP